MIIDLLINAAVLVLGTLFSWLPQVTTLPTIGGFDIDAALVTGMGQFNVFVSSFWPIKYMFVGFLFIMTYYLVKMGVIFFLGHRAPGGR